MKKNDWSQKLSNDEEQIIIKYILVLHKIIQDFSHDQNINHNLILSVRNITTSIGRRKNLKISLEAEKILGHCTSISAIENAQKRVENRNLTIREHKITVADLYKELKNSQKFSEDDAKKWLDKSIIAIITEKENEKLRLNKWSKNRPDDAYEQLGIILKDVWL